MTIHVHGWLFGILRARGGGSLNWKSKSIGGYLRLEFRINGGVLDLEFPQGKDESVFLENAYFIDLISLQTKHELTTLLMAAEDKHPLISDVFIWYSLVEENQQKVGFTSSSRKRCCKTSIFSLMKAASKMILSIRCQTWFFDRGYHFKFQTPKAQIQDGGNKNTHTSNTFRVYKGSSQHILMFCTKLGQCKVRPGSGAELFMRRT